MASVLPFLALLGNPELIETNRYLKGLYDSLGFESAQNFLALLGFGALGILVLNVAVRTLTQYAILRFSNMRLHSFSQKLLKTYLSMPYEFHLENSPTLLTRRVLSESGKIVSQSLIPLLNFFVYGLVASMLVAMLILANPTLALILMGIFGGFYFVSDRLIRHRLIRLGKLAKDASRDKFKLVSETLGGIKDIKVLGREEAYFKAYTDPSFRYAHYQSSSKAISLLPGHLLEIIVFGAVLTVALVALRAEGSAIGDLLPILGLYALGAMRLKPAMSHMFGALSSIRFGTAALDEVFRDIASAHTKQSGYLTTSDRLKFKREITLNNITFAYPKAQIKVLENFTLQIPKNTTIGIVGPSGSGKSTLVDLILGLLKPIDGELLLDGEPLDESRLRCWQNSIGYVPQFIFLTDDSIAENIAFGVDPSERDQAKIEAVARMAQIHEFVEGLPRKYQTKIGERGVRLSGGQRQRLGIARALYHDPEVLIFDEATSALDNETEKEVISAIKGLAGTKTIIMIAHRLSTMEIADRVISLNESNELYSSPSL